MENLKNKDETLYAQLKHQDTYFKKKKIPQTKKLYQPWKGSLFYDKNNNECQSAFNFFVYNVFEILCYMDLSLFNLQISHLI